MAYGSTLLTGDENDNLLEDSPSLYEAEWTGHYVDPDKNIEETDEVSGDDTLLGAGGNDTLEGFEGNDSYEGGAGDDFLIDVPDNMDFGWQYVDDAEEEILVWSKRQHSGDDTMTGGAGIDTLSSFHGEDLLNGGAGNDTIYSGEGNDTAYGGEGDDNLIDLEDPEGEVDAYLREFEFEQIEDGAKIVSTDYIHPYDYVDGQDTFIELYDRSGDDLFDGGDGNDYLSGLGGKDNLEGGAGNDTLDGGGGNDLLSGSDGNDLIMDHWGHHVVPWYDGADFVFLKGGGNDKLLGGHGNDTLSAGIGNDLLFGEEGNDQLVGGKGEDKLFGGEDDDLIIDNDIFTHYNGNATYSLDYMQEPFADFLSGDAGNDTLISGVGADILSGGSGNDVLFDDDSDVDDHDLSYSFYTEPSNDTLLGGGGNDHLTALLGDNSLKGGSGEDTLIAGEGNDTLRGGDDNDTLQGGEGRDVLRGDGGENKFVYTALTDSMSNGPDFIIGFNQGADVIGLDGLGFTGIQQGSASGTLLGFNQRFNDTFIYDEDNFEIRLDGIFDLTNADFGGFEGGGGDDTTPGGGGDDTTGGGNDDVNFIEGTPGNDTIYGSGDEDLIHGLAGNDSIRAGGGEDTLLGGDGRDILHSGDGNDIFLYNDLDESVSGNHDFLIGFDVGEDKMDLTGLGFTGVQQGTASGSVLGWEHKWGDTHVTNADGSFEIELDGTLTLSEDDFLGLGSTGGDNGNGGDDTNPGGDDDPSPSEDYDITGSSGNDTLFGTAVAETIGGLGGNDTIRAGDGDDTLVGGEGRDVLKGDGGNDVFRYDHISESSGGSPDLIVGFEQGMDRLDLSALGFTGIQQGDGNGSVLGWEQKWGDTHITNEDGSFEVEIDGLFNLSEADFLFA